MSWPSSSHAKKIDMEDWDGLYALGKAQIESRRALKNRIAYLRTKGWTWQMLADVLDMHMPTLRRQFYAGKGISLPNERIAD